MFNNFKKIFVYSLYKNIFEAFNIKKENKIDEKTQV